MPSKSSSELFGEELERVRHRWRHTTASPDLPPAKPAPRPLTVALSREYGCRGKQIALQVGERTGWPVYDRELLERISEKVDVRAELFESVDERHTSWLSDCLEAIGGNITISGEYVKYLPRVLLSLASHGDSIIVGRGAAFLLPEKTTLRVRLVAPLKARAEWIGRDLNLSPSEASRKAEKTDAERKQFAKDFFTADASDVHNYDLLLNTARFSDAQCAEIIVHALDRFKATEGE